MDNENNIEKLLNEFKSRYGFLLNIVNRSNTSNLPHNLYRVRLVNKNEEIKKIEQLSYPKAKVNLGRCNFAKEPIFYCSDKATTAIAEILKYQKPLNKHLYISVWKFKPSVEIDIFPLLKKAKHKQIFSKIDPLIIISNKGKRQKAEKQLLEIEKYFYDDNHLQSACMSKVLLSNDILPCDCIFYPSVIPNEKGINIALKTEYFEENVVFQRAYMFELTGFPKNYKVLPLKYTLSHSNDLIWQETDFDQLLLRTLLNQDLNLLE